MLKIEQSGSFHETYTQSSSSMGAAGISFPESEIFPIYFDPIFEESMKGRMGNFQTSWRNTFEEEYIYAIQFELLSLSAFYELPSKLLAGFIDIEDDDSDGAKAQKLMENYSRYQKVGLKTWVKQEAVWRRAISYNDNSSWMPAGETVLQNKGMQMKINLLPYLGVTRLNMLSGAIGFQVVDKGNGKLGGADYITVMGEWKYTLTAFPRVTGVINLVNVVPPPVS